MICNILVKNKNFILKHYLVFRFDNIWRIKRELNDDYFQNLSKGYLARKNAAFRPKAFGILQERVLQYLAWRDVRREQIKVDNNNEVYLFFFS